MGAVLAAMTNSQLFLPTMTVARMAGVAGRYRLLDVPQPRVRRRERSKCEAPEIGFDLGGLFGCGGWI